MSDIQYDPACRDCRRDAGKDNAGTTWQCWPHIKRERDEARAQLANALDSLNYEHDQRLQIERAYALADTLLREMTQRWLHNELCGPAHAVRCGSCIAFKARLDAFLAPKGGA